jgi:hypothetical protein
MVQDQPLISASGLVPLEPVPLKWKAFLFCEYAMTALGLVGWYVWIEYQPV